MSSKRRSPKAKTLSIPINGPSDINVPICIVIGQLIVNWANNESVFLAMLQNLLACQTHRQAAIVWHSHKNTRSRLQLVDSLARDLIRDDDLKDLVLSASKHFYNLTKVRNFYCHGIYRHNDDMAIIAIQSFDIKNSDENDDVVTQKNKIFNVDTIKEISDISMKFVKTNRELWAIVREIGEHTGQQHAQIPPQILEPETPE